MSQRFSYVKYDEGSVDVQESLKKGFEHLEEMAEAMLLDGRPKSLVMTHLEEAYMWTGKAIRDAQIKRDSQPGHVPERSNQ